MSVEIGESEAPFLRLYFGNLNLGNESYVKITSLYDNVVQEHNSETLTSWRNTSIFFNGDELLVELFVHKYDTNIQMVLEKLLVGDRLSDQSAQLSRTICGEDDRVSSDDNAVARMVPVGCTAWIAHNGLLISAGHCHYFSGNFSEEIIQFNVPSSLGDGTIQHPGVDDQYIIGDYEHHNYVYGEPPGIDWLVFNVFDNPTTGLQPLNAQDAYFELERTDIFDDNEVIRITGYGVDGPSPDYGSNDSPRDEGSQTQQTESGDFYSLSGTRLNYVVDTQGANSGSPIIRENSGKAVGVHTDGGCTSTGGYNSGTSLLNENFWDAIGVEVTATLTNRNFETDELLEDTLALKELETGTEIIVNSLDDEEIPISIEHSYTARTFNYEIDELHHHNWNTNKSYLIKWENINIPGGVNNFPVTAFFQNKFQISVTSDYPVETHLHDPWYLENPEADPSDWIQPDAFRPLSDQIDENGNLQVFLNQGQINNPNSTAPIYRIKAPAIGEIGQNDIFIFSHWAPHEGIDYGNGINTPSYDLETDVVFKDANAEVTPVYSSVSELPNYTLTIEQGTTLSIQSGTSIQFASGFKIIVEGELDFQATAEAPITLEGVADERWAGIEVMPSSYWNPSHIILKDAEIAIKMDNVEPASIFSCQFENCGTGLELSRSIFTVSNNSFRNSFGIRVYSPHGITIADINNNDFNNCSIGVMADGTATIRVSRNVFSQDSYGMASIITSINSYSTNRIINNTIVGNPNQTMGIALYSPDVEVKNNIIINCERGITSTFLPTNCEENPFVLPGGFNDIWGNELNYCNIYPTETDVSVDPLLDSNRHLTENSPCIDAGDPDSPLDPDGTQADMGAYYYDAPPQAPENLSSAFLSEPACQNCHNVSSAVELSWDELPITDLSYYTIYRAENEGNCIRCHEANNHEPLGERRELMDDPFILGKDCPNLSGEVIGLSRNRIEIETGCRSSNPNTRTMTFEPIWAWNQNYLIDFAIRGNTTYAYYVTATDWIDQEGEASAFTLTYVPVIERAKTATEMIPKEYALFSAYPNPFNPITNIKIDIPENSYVKLTVFDLSGRVVTELLNQNITAGTHHTIWNGKDKNGNSVSSGVYLYTLTAKSQETVKYFTKSNKMILLK